MNVEILEKYEAVIGLEVHAQLATQSKLFCGDSTAFGAEPNTHISAITMAHPGILPKINKKAVEYAVKMGIACGCKITKFNYFARKNYLYPDLPKGFQTTQHTTPICVGGIVKIKAAGKMRNIRLHHIHMEEDAGKSIHDIYAEETCVDLNRAGTPLIEIVSEPDIRTAEEAGQYVSELRKLVRWIGICDGNMEEGSLRCDANVSIRLKGENLLNTRVEIKNLNSIRNIKKAIQYEIERMIELVESGGVVTQQTLSFDTNTDTTFPIRDKEDANDYRYFPEPDLAPLQLTEEYIEKIKNQLPELPDALLEKYINKLGLNEYDAEQICFDKETADFFEKIIPLSRNYKAIANWVNGPLKHYCNEQKINFDTLQLNAEQLTELIDLIDSGKINFSVASAHILPELIGHPNNKAIDIATSKNLIQVSDSNELEAWIDEVITKMPEKAQEYQNGKKGLIGLFIGEVKKISKGKADPKKVAQILEQKLLSH